MDVEDRQVALYTHSALPVSTQRVAVIVSKHGHFITVFACSFVSRNVFLVVVM